MSARDMTTPKPFVDEAEFLRVFRTLTPFQRATFYRLLREEGYEIPDPDMARHPRQEGRA